MIAAALALALSAQPSPMRLGEDLRAKVRIECAAEPSLAASIGRIEGLKRTGAASWEADFVPPDEELPQVALLTAVAGGDVGFLAIPLWAEGDAVVKTRPGGRITVEIGSRTFGPVIADANGQALVPVVVPPGVPNARHGKRLIPLGVAPTRTVHVAFGEAGHRADQAQNVAVYAVAVTAQGDPRPAAPIRLQASRGVLGAMKELQPGLYQAWLSLPEGPPGPVRVTAVLDDAPAFVARAALTLGGGPADRIKVTADRERISAQDPHAVLHVSARDARGNAPGEMLRFEASAGEVHATSTAPGEWDLALALPSSFAGLAWVEVRAVGAQAAAAKRLDLVPGPAEVVIFANATATVVADGESPLRLAMELRDRYGNAVQGVRPEVTAEEGQAQVEEREGTLYASYVPPLRREPGATVISARAGPAVGSARLTLLPALKPLALGAKAGMLSNFSGFSAPLLGVEAGFRTAAFGAQLGFSLEADYVHREQSELLSAGGADVLARSRLELALLHASVAWRHALGTRDLVWVAAGPSAAAYWSTVSVAGGASQRGFAIAPGLHAALGAERRFSRAVPFLEARAGWITSPGLPALSGPLRTLSLFAGVRFKTL
jgi:hypothetical protein